MDDFYTRMNLLFETGELSQSLVECELSKRLRTKYNISVLCNGFATARKPDGTVQAKFYFLIDTKESNNDMIRSLSSLKGVANYGVNINSPSYGDCFRDFAKQVVKEYIEVSEVEFDDYDDFIFIVYEFNEAGKNHLYGKSCVEVKKYLHEKYNVNMRDVVGVEDSKYYVLVDKMEDYINIVHHKAETNDIVYEMMSKYDYFGVLRNKKVNISYLLKAALDEEELKGYLIRRSLF